MAQRRAQAATEKDQEIAHRSNFHIGEINPACCFCRRWVILARIGKAQNERRQWDAAALYSGVIPGRCESIEPGISRFRVHASRAPE